MKNSAQEMNTPMIMTGTAPMILVPLSTMSIMNTSMILTMNSMLPIIIVTPKPLMGISTSMTMLHMKSMRMICMFTAMIAELLKTALLPMSTTTGIIFITVIFTPTIRSIRLLYTRCLEIRHGTGLLRG